MRSYRLWKALKILAIVAIGCTVFGFVVMHLWNWLMPTIFGLTTITFTQALGLLVLSKILLGGFHRHGGGGRNWKRHMDERWAKMTPEERTRFQSGMRGFRGCRPGRPTEAPADQTVA